MRIKRLGYALSIFIAAALLSACGAPRQGPSDMPPVGAPGAMQQASASAPAHKINYEILYRFKGKADGHNPEASLVNVGGTLYGTTEFGGAFCEIGCGTVFSVTTGGSEEVIYSFGGGAGEFPRAALIDVGGTLYGTAVNGGAGGGHGTVFSITPGGTVNVLHAFTGGRDGRHPEASVIDVGGTLYGTTEYGGGGKCRGSESSCGTVYSVTLDGAEKVLHRFGRGTDGGHPVAPLIKVKHLLYGTTEDGGAYGAGTVFTITPGGTEKVLYSFGSVPNDAADPHDGLVEFNGTLYGTTFRGGLYSCDSSSCGTVFSITPSGVEKVLHSFGSGSDGIFPRGSLIHFKGALYGTTSSGGAHGDGTIFSMTPSGTEKVVYSFGSVPNDGVFPDAGLINVGGTLYGTTSSGGKHDGTVFAITP